VIGLDRVSVRYGTFQALTELTVRIETGECLALVGPSGSGKTTALRVMNGMATVSAGAVSVGDRPIAQWKLEQLRRSMGYVIQEVGLLPHWTVEQNVSTVPRMLGWTPASRQERAESVIQQVGLERSDLRKYPHELSGGQRQRVGMARALAAKPKWLLMDEPFGAVDPLTREQLRTLLRTLRAESPVTTVLVTHDLGDAFALADRVAVLRGGRVVQLSSPDELVASPKDDWVASFVRAGTREAQKEST
jgi:osmoprotectant transport system ATP-binding protein